jgi:2,4-diketo-3-deoxy-L-fuconate hydrolase
MKLCRFADNRLGLVEGHVVKDVTAIHNRLPAARYPLPRHDTFIAALPGLRGYIEGMAINAEAIPLENLALLSPAANPGKIVAAPVNYKKHLEEVIGDPALHHGVQIKQIQEIGLFLKAPSSLVGASSPVRLRFPERRTDHEIELAVVIGKRASQVSKAEALDHVAGYAIGLDMTLRGPEERSLRKSIDSYTVMGPWMVTADEFGDPADAGLHLQVNGETRQQANTKDLILSVADLIAFASSFYTLEPGDVILSGTPEGVAQVHPGDVMTATIDRIGTMTVRVEAG